MSAALQIPSSILAVLDETKDGMDNHWLSGVNTMTIREVGLDGRPTSPLHLKKKPAGGGAAFQYEHRSRGDEGGENRWRSAWQDGRRQGGRSGLFPRRAVRSDAIVAPVDVLCAQVTEPGVDPRLGG